VPLLLAAGLGRAGNILVLLLDFYALAILAVSIMSWFPLRPGSPVWPVYRFLMRITDPVLARVRAAMPRFSSIDISPMVVLLGIFVLQALIRG
jgi:YggT family protein